MQSWVYAPTGRISQAAAVQPMKTRAAAKMDWLRQVMEWHDELGGAADLSSLLYQQTTQQRVFITTPKGHVVDLAGGATVLDFAYRIHTDLGSRCVGGLVNGVFMPIQQSCRMVSKWRCCPTPATPATSVA
ncbi:MAG: hypothetical protein CM15mP120_21970 [Pseudomonadota bacterium]|nr:MAG: hypothetical protein CM15mP120_21970 [Pseudomonadota bacterium]